MMKVVHYTNSVSAHQLPLDRELVKMVGVENFRYVSANVGIQENQAVEGAETWITNDNAEARKWMEVCDILLVGGLRPIDLMERRLAAGKITFYMSERWFKPINLGVGHRCRCSVPGWVRLFVPSYFKMAKRFVRLFKSPYYRFLPIGPWSAHDMRLICRIMSFLHLHLPPTPQETSHFSFLTSHFINWGDFVSPSVLKSTNTTVHQQPILTPDSHVVRVLWVGRMLDWKRVDTLIKAIAFANEKAATNDIKARFTLTIVGKGPEEEYLKKMVLSLGMAKMVNFLPQVKITEIRPIMRAHNIYVLPSNAYEGWGAVVPEAMTEGMTVLGTYEAGASAALLPESNLFHCGDWKTLSKLLLNFATPNSQPSTLNPQPTPLPYDYTPKGAAERLLKVAPSTSSTLLHG